MSVLTRIRAYPRVAATGAAVAIFLAGGNAAAPLHDGLNHYRAGIIAHPRFEASVSFDDDGWAARAVPTASAIGWSPAEAASLDELSALYWRDAAIEIDRVVDGVVFRRLAGTIAEASISAGKLVITCADLAQSLDKPVTAATFAGTGGIEGGDFAIGRAKRRSFGRVWNVEGRLLDKVNNIYEFGDPAFPLQGCTALRDMGRAGPLGIIAWQGSIAATLNALKAATPERGGGLFAPSIGCAKWWTQPAGPLTADLLGEAAGYSETAAGIAAQLLGLAQGPTISNLAAANALRPAVCGLHIGDNSETTSAALDRLLQRVTLGWRLTPAGAVEIWNYTFTGPVETLNATFISRESTIQPVKSRQVGYKKNERVHGDGEISAAVQASDVVYEDGTTAEDWKPADKGATNGASAAEKDQLAQLEADTATAKTNIAAAQAQIAAIQSSVATDFSAVNAEVDALQGSLSIAQSNISALQSGQSSLSTSVSNLQSSMTAAQSSISNLQSSVNASLSALNSDVDALETQAAGIISSVTGLGDEITALGDDVATLESTVSAHGSSIGQNAIAIAGLSGNLATLTTRVNAGGNTNLIPGLESGFAGWSAPSFDLIVSGGWGLVASRMTDSDQLIFLDSPPAPVFATLTYTAAADSVLQIAGGTGSARVEILFKDSAGEIIGNPQSGSRSANHDFTNDGSSRAILKATGIAPANAVTAAVRLTAQKNSGTLTVVGWRQVKLEQGSVATPYSFDASVYQQFQAISTLDVGFASLTTTVGAQGSIITQNSQAISGLQGSLSSLSSDVSVHGANISSLQQASTSQAGQLAQHTTDIATANSNISINAQAINTANGSLAGLTTRVGAAESAANINATAISGVAGRTATLESTVSAQGSSIGQNATAIVGLGSSLAQLTTRVTAGSNNNLVPGLESGMSGWSAPSFSLIVSGGWGLIASRTTDSDQLIFLDSPPAPVFATLTYTAAADSVLQIAGGTGSARVEILFKDSAGEIIGNPQSGSRIANHDFTNDGSSRAILTATGIAPANAVTATVRLTAQKNSGTLTVVGWRQVKLEQGSVATPYSFDASVYQQFQAISTLDVGFASLETRVVSAEGSITTLQSSMTSTNGSISTLQTNVSSLSGAVSTLQSSSTTQAGQISTLQSTVASQGATISSNSQAITTMQGSLATLSNVVSASSSPNLIPGFEIGLTGWYGDGFSRTISGGWGMIAYRNSPFTGLAFLDSPIVPAWQFKPYTAAADSSLFTTGMGSTRVEILFKDGAGNIIGNPQSQSRYAAPNVDFVDDGSSRATLTASGYAPAGTVSVQVRLTAQIDSGSPSSIAWRQVKLEQGTVATPYSGEASAVQTFQAYADLNSSYATLSTTVSSQGGAISTLQSSYTSLNGTVSTLSSTVSAQGTSITNLQSASSTQAGQISTLSTTVSAQGAQVDNLQIAYSGLNGTVATLQGTVSANSASISTLQSATSTLQGNVATLTTRVSAAGGNLLPNGGLENGFNTGVSDPGGFNFVTGGWGPIAETTANGLHVFYFNPVENPQIGAQYTVAMDPLNFGASDIYCNIVCVNSAGNVLLDGTPGTQISGGDFSNNDDRRARSACTVTVPSNTARLIVRAYGTVRDGQPIGFRRVKLERSNTWSPYTAEASIVQQFQTLSTLTTQYASLSSTVATQGVNISTQATAISTLNGSVSALMGKWGFEIDVQGYVSGMVQNNNGQRAATIFRSDQFGVRPPGGTTDGYYIEFDSAGRTTQYIRSGDVRVVESGWLT